MQVQQRGASWQASVSHKGERYRRSFKTRSDALRWALEAEERLGKGDLPDMGGRSVAGSGKPRTMQQLLDWTYETRWRSQRSSAKSRTNAQEVVDILGPNLSIDRMDAFMVGKVRMQLMKSGVSNATINRKMAALGAMMTEADRLELITRKPRIDRLEETEKRQFRFTPEIEAKAIALFNRLGQEWMADFILISLYTGLRQGEVLGLRFDDCMNSSITVTETKSGKNRVIPMNEQVRDALKRRMYANLDTPEGSLRKPFAEYSASAVAAQWHKLRVNLGLVDEPSFVPHILRHEFCSRLADKGVAAQVIQKLAGHSSLLVTQRYINLSPVGLKDAVSRL